MASDDGVTCATAWICCPAGTATVAGSKATFQPLGAVADRATAAMSAVPVFDTTTVMSLAAPAVALMLRRWSAVVRVIVYDPVISTSRSWCAVCAPLETSTEIGNLPAAAFAAGVTDTVTGDVAPAFTTTLAACAEEPTCEVTVQPAGPVATALNGRSSGVELVSVRVNGNVALEAPFRLGISVVRVTSPAALGVTRTSTGSVSDARDPFVLTPRTTIRCVPPVAPVGTVTARVTLVGVFVPSVSTPSTVKPPPRRVAVHSAGAPVTVRSTRSGVSVVIEMSKLTVDPGEVATAGYGVVSVSWPAAPTGTAPTRDTRPSIDETRPSLAPRVRTDQASDTRSTSLKSDVGTGVIPRVAAGSGLRNVRGRTGASLTPRRPNNQPRFDEET